MYKILIIFIFIFFSKIALLSCSCIPGLDHCSICNPLTDLCFKCEKEIFTPDEKGGCEYAKICMYGNNYCIKCSEEKDKENLCIKCEDGYYPDEYGGCSYTKNCILSERGKCLKCKEDYILVGIENYLHEGIKICKSLFAEDLKFCETINYNNGLCDKCKENYYVNQKDKKCSNTKNCDESIFGICINCHFGYYLDKKNNECKEQKDNFVHCKESMNGENCYICDEDFYFDENGICIFNNNCLRQRKDLKCEKCIENYYLTEIDNICTTEKNCEYGDRNTGICLICKDNYYIDYKDGKCKSNLENNDFKHCRYADGFCKECDVDYYIGDDHKCSTTRFCSESNDGICFECTDNYHLGLDNRCTNIKYCIYSDNYNKCLECEDGFYFNKDKNSCIISEGNFTNCKIGYNNFCERCKDDFYLNQTNHLCYSNKEEGIFYRCGITDIYGEYCMDCRKDYYLGYTDNKCSKVLGCEISENEDRCALCSDYYCLNINNGQCKDNDFIENEDEKFYFRCNKTNKEGNSCEICLDGFKVNEDGLCVSDDSLCEEIKDEICQKCKNDDGNYCLNKEFGCVETYNDNCLECNDILDFDYCTKCFEGYEINRFGECVEINKDE